MTEESDAVAHQGIGRAALVISLLAEAADTGLHFAEVMRRSGLSKATTHRILAGLVHHRLVDFDEGSKSYYLGMRMVGWATAAGNRFGLRSLGPALDRMAADTQDTIYLLVRSGPDAICIDRREGSFPIRILPVHIGESRPLGVGAAALAILAALPDNEIKEVLAAREAERRAFGFTDAEVWETVANTRKIGHAAVEGRLINTMSAFGVPLFDSNGSPIAALSVASLVERLTDRKRADIVAMLQREAADFHAARRTRRS